GIWPDRDIAAGWCGLETPCASLPTRSPGPPRTRAPKAGDFDLRKRLRARDGLSAGGSEIRTLGPGHEKAGSVPSRLTSRVDLIVCPRHPVRLTKRHISRAAPRAALARTIGWPWPNLLRCHITPRGG